MRYAKLGEEIINRQSELEGEEFRLYMTIVFHTDPVTEICNITLGEISEIYKWDYSNTTRRYKKLRQKGWCENTEKGIRPLVGRN